MSLISDALRKARQDVARQESERQGGLPPALPYHMPIRRAGGSPPRPAWFAALVGGFIGAVIVSAGLLWFYRPGLAPASPAGPGLEASPAAAAASPAVTTAGRASSPAANPSRPAIPGPLPVEPAAGATAAITELTLPTVTPAVASAVAAATAAFQPASPGSATASSPTSGTTPREPSSPAAPPAGAAPRDTAALAPPATAAAGAGAGAPPPYRIRLADGQELVLRGIAAGEGAPVALINRAAVGVGEMVDGWKVARIEPREVELVRGSETVVLSLR